MKMKLFILFALVAVAAARTCIPSNIVSHAIPPPTLTSITSAASSTDPSLKTDIRIIEAITGSSPSFIPVESEIESYEQSHYYTVGLIQEYMSSPSAITNPSYFTSLVSLYPTLASALSVLVSVEASHSSLYDIQSSFEAVMVNYPTIVTVGESTFDWSYAQLRSDQSGISKVAVATPSIVTDVQVLTTAEIISPSLATDFADVISAAEYYPSAIAELTTARDWTETDAWYIDKTLKSIISCYPTFASDVIAIDSFLSTHSSDLTDIKSVISVLTSSPSIVTEVTDVETQLSTSFTHAVTAISPVVQVAPHITTEITYLDVLEATSPTLSCAEGTIERDIVSHYNTVNLIETAIVSPSTVTNPTLIVSLEDEYPSIVSAYEDITFVESSHPSLEYVQTSIQYAETIESTILTAASEVISGTSPSIIGYASDLEKVESVSSSIVYVLASLSSMVSKIPSLSCDEAVIAHYASEYPSVLKTISEALSSPSDIPASSVQYIAQLTAEFPSLASAFLSIDSVVSTFPQVTEVEQALTFALTYEPTLITDYTKMASYAETISSEMCSIAPSASD